MGWIVKAIPRPLYPRERPGAHCIGGWVGPRASLNGCEKSRPPPLPGFDPQTVQPVASGYTDYAIPAQAEMADSFLNQQTYLKTNSVTTLPFTSRSSK